MIKKRRTRAVILAMSLVVLIYGVVTIGQLHNHKSYAAANARFPGDPNPRVSGKAYWGEGYSGNGDVKARHETSVGKSVSIHRTFFNTWPAPASLYSTVKDDHVNNRLPFVSVKLPSWTNAAAGQYNTDIDQMLKQLDVNGKPVWLTIHHEPEGGGGTNAPDDPGGAPAWRNMQTVIRQRMNVVGAKNIAFMPILMSYTWNPASGRNPDDWWVPGIWDAYIVDHYRDTTTGNMFTSNQWSNFVTWAEVRNIPFGTGEWGNRGTDAQAAQEMQDFWEWGFINRKDVIAHTYFDSGLNTTNGSWEITGDPLVKFRQILGTDTRVQRINDLGTTVAQTPTPTPLKSSTLFDFTLALHGIGSGGDNANPAGKGNSTPKSIQREVTIEVLNEQNVVILIKQGTLNYNSSSGTFQGTVDMGNTLTSGLYSVRVKTNQFLRGLVPGVRSITAGTKVILPKATLRNGDANNDNMLNITDFNMIMGCYSDLRAATNCPTGAKEKTDLTNDGLVNQLDFNLFLREISTFNG